MELKHTAVKLAFGDWGQHWSRN